MKPSLLADLLSVTMAARFERQDRSAVDLKRKHTRECGFHFFAFG
jgi:hypothetical protein